MATRRRPQPIALVPLCLVLLLGASLPSARPAAAVPCDPPRPVDDERASEILAAERPFAPTNRDLFYTFDHPDWADAAPPESPEGPGLSEEETRDVLRSFLERRFPCSPARISDGMGTYDDAVAREKFPEPTLRAALAALTGTLGEPAIEFLLYRTPVTLVNFGIFVESGTGLPGRVAGVNASPDGTVRVVVDRRFRFLPFGAFSALLAHEALHTGLDGDAAGLPEEAVATAVEALVYMEMLLTDSALARLPDELTRFNSNHMVLVRLNSGPPGSDRLTLFVPDSDVNVDPLAVEPLTEFYEYYFRYSAPADPEFRERETEGNWLLREVLRGLAEPDESAAINANTDFDEETLEFADRNQAVLSPADLIAVACILELDVPCDEGP